MATFETLGLYLGIIAFFACFIYLLTQIVILRWKMNRGISNAEEEESIEVEETTGEFLFPKDESVKEEVPKEEKQEVVDDEGKQPPF